MPYNLTLDNNPEFSSSLENQPNVQDWSFDPESPIEVDYNIGEALPSSINLNVTIRNYLLELQNLDYFFYIKHVVSSPQQGIPELINLTGNINDAQGNGLQLLGVNIQQLVIINFQNLQIVPEGVYNNIIGFQIFKENPSTNELELYDVRFFSININVIEGNPFIFTPQNLTFVHVNSAGTNAPQSLDISATGNFSIYVKSYIALSGGNLNDEGIVNYWLPGPGQTRKYTGSNSQIVSIDTNVELNDFDQGEYNSELKYDNGILFKSLNLRTVVFDTDETTFTPESLEFYAVKGFTEAGPQQLTILSPHAFIIQAPSWLTVTPSSGIFFLNLSVVPVLSENLSEGVYEGNLVITANGQDYLVPITHTVVDAVELGMSQDEINFTEDLNTITRVYNENNYRLELELNITTHNYNSDVEMVKNLYYKIPLFNNKGEFYVGRTLNKIMPELLSLLSINLLTLEEISSTDSQAFLRPYYRPANVNVNLKFVDIESNELIANPIYNNIKFLKGRKPINVFPNSAILNYHSEDLRVTPNSIALFNYYKTQSHFIRIYKNGVLHDAVSQHMDSPMAWLFKYGFNAFAAADIVEIRLYKAINQFTDDSFYESANNYVSQKYIVLPEGKRSYHIAWEDEYGVLDMMEFTGDIRFNMSYESKIIKDYKSFKEILRKIDSRRSQNVTINTGYLLKENPKRLDSLLNSRRAWIMSETEEAIMLIPDTKQLENYDSERELYAYDIEFKINLNDDNKINS